MQEDAIKEDSDDESQHNPDERISSMSVYMMIAAVEYMHYDVTQEI